MKHRTFKRGIHPPDNKVATDDKPIRVLTPEVGQMMIFPMIQHLGAPCTPTVKVGDYVTLGQVIGSSDAYVSAPIHSSVSGYVRDIRPTLTPTGITATAVVVENDGVNELSENMVENPHYLEFTREQCLKIIQEAGIVGLGGAGFPTHVKLNPPPGSKIDYIIVNASECEPYLTTDHRVLLEEGDRLKKGLLIVLKMFPGAKGLIGIETNKMDAIEHLKKLCADCPNIEIVPLIPKYPEGAEKQLIIACTGRTVPSGKLPADIGVIVNNVDTIIAIDRAVRRGRPLIRKVVTVTGGAVRNPGNFKVRLGTTYRKLIEESGGFISEPIKMVSGGPMMGVAMFDLDIPVIKTSSAIICFTEEEAHLPDELNCIRCGKCVEHCPAGLLPLDLNQYVLRNDMESFEKMRGKDCIECGSCSYVCPAKRHLAHSIRSARRTLLAKKK